MNENGKDPRDEKQLKREAREQWDESRAVAQSGDYWKLRALDRKLVELAPTLEPGENAAAELKRLKVDRVAIYVGAGALLLYALAWLVSLP